MIGRTCATLGVATLVLTAAACSDGDPTPQGAVPSPPTLVLDHVVHIPAPSGYPDTVTGCLPGTSVRVFLGQDGYYKGLAVAAVVDVTCVQRLRGPQ